MTFEFKSPVADTYLDAVFSRIQEGVPVTSGRSDETVGIDFRRGDWSDPNDKYDIWVYLSAWGEIDEPESEEFYVSCELTGGVNIPAGAKLSQVTAVVKRLWAYPHYADLYRLWKERYGGHMRQSEAAYLEWANQFNLTIERQIDTCLLGLKQEDHPYWSDREYPYWDSLPETLPDGSSLTFDWRTGFEVLAFKEVDEVARIINKRAVGHLDKFRRFLQRIETSLIVETLLSNKGQNR